MSRASETALDSLHALLSETLQQELKRYKDANEAVPPALLAQCIKFLKDNGIDSPQRAKKTLDTLAEAMPDFDEQMPSLGPTH